MQTVMQTDADRKNALGFVFDITPQRVRFGCFQDNEERRICAVVTACYEPRHAPLINAFVDEMMGQYAVPILAIYGDTVQIVLTISPVTKGGVEALESFFDHPIPEFEEFDTVRIASMTEADRESDDFKTFTNCVQRDGFAMMDFAVPDDSDADVAIPFATVTVRKIEPKRFPA